MKKSIIPLVILFIATISFSCQKGNEAVSLSTLLEEMTKQNLLSEYPEPYFTLRQFSSYDQRSLAPDQEGWFANHDASWFIRTEENQGRREFVMFDATGPGAIVRFWMTFGNEAAYTGTLRIYFDGANKPEIEGPVLEIISGGKLVGEPLSSSVSPETNYYHRGHNLYLPIPYAERCKVTYECPALDPDKHSPSVYYNINYRTYETGSMVTTFSLDQLSQAADQILVLQQNLVEGNVSEPAKTTKTELIGSILPGESIKTDIKGKGAIYNLSFLLGADYLPQALRSTIISIDFDGEQTVWSPIGDFFGTGYKSIAYKTWHTSVDENGLMNCYWTMPFKKSAVITISNLGEQTVEIKKGEAVTGAYKWTGNTMYFSAKWHEYHSVETAGAKGVGGTDQHFDINFSTFDGAGVYAGDAITIFNTADAWWGEGDEKVYVDGETFPSHIGTGTEDYIGYAWCRPEPFSHFLIAQPDGSGNFHTGMTVNMRHRLLDGIPFTKSLKFDMELWHWAPTIMNYAVVSYCYLKPGGNNLTVIDPEIAKEKVMFTLSDFVNPVPVENGLLEGENLRVLSVSAGSWQVQQSTIWNWSNNKQLWWMDGGENGVMNAEFEMPLAGNYNIEAVFTKAIDYGMFKISINGTESKTKFQGYHDQTGADVITQKVNLGNFKLNEGKNEVLIKITGKHPKAQPGYMVGIDYLQFDR